MSYSLESREKVINFVKNGGIITEVSHIFGRGIALIYRWLFRLKLEATKVKNYQIKLD